MRHFRVATLVAAERKGIVWSLVAVESALSTHPEDSFSGKHDDVDDVGIGEVGEVIVARFACGVDTGEPLTCANPSHVVVIGYGRDVVRREKGRVEGVALVAFHSVAVVTIKPVVGTYP